MLCKYGYQNSDLSTYVKLDMVVCIYNPSTPMVRLNVERGESPKAFRPARWHTLQYTRNLTSNKMEVRTDTGDVCLWPHPLTSTNALCHTHALTYKWAHTQTHMYSYSNTLHTHQTYTFFSYLNVGRNAIITIKIHGSLKWLSSLIRIKNKCKIWAFESYITFGNLVFIQWHYG